MVGEQKNELLKQRLGALGYLGFAYLSGSHPPNAAEFLVDALSTDDLDARVTEALPWVLFSFPDLDWNALIEQATKGNLQNRLAYLVEVALSEAEQRSRMDLVRTLRARLRSLEPFRLSTEDTLCRKSMTDVERNWLRSNRPPIAERWNLLTDLNANHLDEAFDHASD